MVSSTTCFLCKKMPPQRPTTQQSLKMPKGKNIQICKASSRATVGETKHVPKVEPIIKISQKKVFTQPPLYRYIDSSTTSKVLFSTLNELFNKIHQEHLMFGKT
jgi:hypothetical protein